MPELFWPEFLIQYNQQLDNRVTLLEQEFADLPGRNEELRPATNGVTAAGIIVPVGSVEIENEGSLNLVPGLEPILRFRVPGFQYIDNGTQVDVDMNTNWLDSGGHPSFLLVANNNTFTHIDSNGFVALNAGVSQSDASSAGFVLDNSLASHADSGGAVNQWANRSHADSNGTLEPGTGNFLNLSDCHADSNGIVGAAAGLTGQPTGHHADSGGTVNDAAGGLNSHASSGGLLGNVPTDCHASSLGLIGNSVNSSDATSTGQVAYNAVAGTPITLSISGASARSGGTANANFASATGPGCIATQTAEVAEGCGSSVLAMGKQAQNSRMHLFGAASAVAKILTLDGAAEIALGAEAAQFMFQVAGHDSADNIGCGFMIRGAAYCDGVTATIVAAITDSWIPAALAGSTAVLSVTANTLRLTCTPGGGKTVGWSATGHLERSFL